jgi:hypothetical protein
MSERLQDRLRHATRLGDVVDGPLQRLLNAAADRIDDLELTERLYRKGRARWAYG